MPTLTVDFSTLPTRMKKLPLDPERGVPVPWFVQWVTGEGDAMTLAEPTTPGARPEFRVMDRRKFVRAIKEKLCWVCGETMGKWLAFVAGPMCGTTRTTSEPPCHYECALFSIRNCPFLSNPHMVRREEGIPTDATVAGEAIMRNPGVAMLWVTRGFEKFCDDKGLWLLTMGEPERVEWYREGRPATRAEVQASIDSGLPNLMVIAKTEGPFAVQALGKAVESVQRWLPAM
jgi:hypothetical protein